MIQSLANREWHEDHRWFMDELVGYEDLCQEMIEYVLKNRHKPEMKDLVFMVEAATETLWDEVDKFYSE